MRHSAALAALVLTVLSGEAVSQEPPATPIPTHVRDAHQARFPNAGPVEWKHKNGGMYEAEFLWQHVETTVQFDSTGRWLETEQAVARQQLPALVSAKLAHLFPGYRITETQTVDRFDDSTRRYEIHLEGYHRVVKVQFSEGGALISRVTRPAKPGEALRS